MSNIDRLVGARIVDPAKPRSQEQTDAIESLTEEEVDALISSRDKLSPWISHLEEIITLPGIPGGNPD